MLRKIRKLGSFYSFWILIQTGILFSENPGDIVITEFSIKPGVGVYQYIEIFNTTDGPIDLKDWEIKIDNTTYLIDQPLNISENGFVVFTSHAGRFQDSDGRQYVPTNTPDWSWPAGFTNDFLPSNYYWVKYFYLSPTNGNISIRDNAGIPIDSISYDTSFPIQETGRSAEFILNPIADADSLNDNSSHWRASNYPDNLHLFNTDGVLERGSPAIANFINVEISIIEDSTADSDSTRDTDCKSVYNSTTCLPNSDGFPGGYAAVSLTGSSNNASSLDSIHWIITEGNVTKAFSSSSDSTKLMDNFVLPQDTTTLSIIGDASWTPAATTNTYIAYLFLKDSNGFMGHTQTTIYVNQEINYPPEVHSYTIDRFEGENITLSGLVTDPEICGSVNTPCNTSDIKHVSSVCNNSSPFNWISGDSIGDPTSLLTGFKDSISVSVDGESANNIQHTQEFTLTATDPFCVSDTNIVTVIVHNYNQPPMITIDSTNLIGLDIIAGYSFEVNVSGHQIKLHKYNASGQFDNTIIIAEITDTDGDSNFSLELAEKNCENAITDHYCVDGNMIRTEYGDSDLFYDLSFPIWINDNSTVSNSLVSQVEDLYNYSRSDTVLGINDIRYLIPTVHFPELLIDDDGYHIPEDTTLITGVEVEFTIDFSLLSQQEAYIDVFNSDSLHWSFHKLDVETEQRVFAEKKDSIFVIYSLANNFNGNTGLKVIVADTTNATTTLLDSIIINIDLHIDQRNDSLQHFKLYNQLEEYSIDSTILDSVREIVYFRLPQDDEGNSYSPSKELRFQWEKNPELDVDMISAINKDVLLPVYYRLELLDLNAGTITILKDSINHFNFTDYDTIWVDIDFQEPEFPFYYDSLSYNSQLNTHSININGQNVYKWRVVAQNYSQDKLGSDPTQVSTRWDSTDFTIDLIPPLVKHFNIMINELYPGYYDLLWESTGSFLTDSTFLNTKEESNRFSAVSFRNPRRITDTLYNFTGIIPAGITSASISFDLQMRDNAMNSGERKDQVSYFHINPDTPASLVSPSGDMVLFIPKSGFENPAEILITESEPNGSTERNFNELYQLSPTVNFFPTGLSLNKPGSIRFDVSNYISSAVNNWQYVIMELKDEGPQQLTTYFSDGILSANIHELGSFAVFVNSNADRPLPTKFELKANYPNPFNPTTVIPLEIPAESYVKAAIYNILGQEIIVLLEGIQQPGYQHLIWNGTNHHGQQVSSGLYFIRTHYDQNIYHQKMMLLK